MKKKKKSMVDVNNCIFWIELKLKINNQLSFAIFNAFKIEHSSWKRLKNVQKNIFFQFKFKIKLSNQISLKIWFKRIKWIDFWTDKPLLVMIVNNFWIFSYQWFHIFLIFIIIIVIIIVIVIVIVCHNGVLWFGHFWRIWSFIFEPLSIFLCYKKKNQYNVEKMGLVPDKMRQEVYEKTGYVFFERFFFWKFWIFVVILIFE